MDKKREGEDLHCEKQGEAKPKALNKSVMYKVASYCTLIALL
jgi:hypothetical protein